jgi:CheY-like chemotaxis protein
VTVERERRVVTSCTVEFERLGKRITATTEDVSRRGVFLRTAEFLPIGEVVELSITVPGGSVVNVISCVAHVLPVLAARALGRHSGMGFEFLDVDEERLLALKEFLDPLLDESPPLSLLSGGLRVVVADPSARLIERVTRALGDAGFIVSMAANGSDAYAACVDQPPDVLLCADEMPVMDGWTLISMMQSRAKLADVPVVLMSESQSDIVRLKAYRHGVRDFVQKPFTDEELTIRVRRLGRSSRPVSEKVVLRGNLPDIGVTTLLSMFEFEQKSGILALFQHDGAARLFLAKGRIVKVEASADGAPLDKVMSVLGWIEGSFEFAACEVVGEDELRFSTTALLIEHARISDERDRVGSESNDGGHEEPPSSDAE